MEKYSSLLTSMVIYCHPSIWGCQKKPHRFIINPGFIIQGWPSWSVRIGPRSMVQAFQHFDFTKYKKLGDYLLLVGGLVDISFIVPEILGISNHPNWRTHIFQRGGPSTNQFFRCAMVKWQRIQLGCRTSVYFLTPMGNGMNGHEVMFMGFVCNENWWWPNGDCEAMNDVALIWWCFKNGKGLSWMAVSIRKRDEDDDGPTNVGDSWQKHLEVNGESCQ